MRIVFRTDASLQIGTGHVMRCLTLAKALQRRGTECRFICREHIGNLIEKIQQDGFKCSRLPIPKNQVSDTNEPALARAAWIGATWQHDAHETIHALGGELADWLIIDHYGLEKRWESTLRPHAKKLMVLDDLADRYHECDLLLDQNLVSNLETRYHNLLSAHCASLLGPKYALLQPEYAELHPRTPPRTGPVKRILVFFGGADQHNLTGRTISAFLNLKRDDIELDVVINPNSPHASEIHSQMQSYANINIHAALPSLAPLIQQADLAIGAGGATSWERCCLGLPSLVVTLAENQKPIARELQDRSLVRWLGHHDAVTDDVLINALQAVINTEELENWSRACMAVTDGDGVKHVASVLALNSETRLVARLARLDDEAMLLHWANDPLVRENAFNSETITAETHKQWFYERLRNIERCKIYILEDGEGLPIGQVRFERADEEWEIHYALASIARGVGLAKKILETAISQFKIDHLGSTVFGRVKLDNLPSQKIFEGLSFSRRQGRQEIVYRHVLLD